MLKKSEILINRLHNHNVKWVLYKGSYHYIDGFCGKGDIDIYVSEDDLELTHVLLKQIGFVLFKTQSYVLRNGVEDWIGFDEFTGKLIHVHLHSRIVLGHPFIEEYRFKLERECLNHARTVDFGIRIQNRVLESILVLCMYAMGCVSINKIRKYQTAWNLNEESTMVFKNEIKQFHFLDSSEIHMLLDFFKNTCDASYELDSFVKKYCILDIKKWRIKYFIKRCDFNFSRLTNYLDKIAL